MRCLYSLVLALILWPTLVTGDWPAKSNVIYPRVFGCSSYPYQGGGDIYSPSLFKVGDGWKLLFGGWYEQCRLNDAIYEADYDPTTGVANNPRIVIDPLNFSRFEYNDPSVVFVGNHWVTYMTDGGYGTVTSTSADGEHW